MTNLLPPALCGQPCCHGYYWTAASCRSRRATMRPARSIARLFTAPQHLIDETRPNSPVKRSSCVSEADHAKAPGKSCLLFESGASLPICRTEPSLAAALAFRAGRIFESRYLSQAINRKASIICSTKKTQQKNVVFFQWSGQKGSAKKEAITFTPIG